MQGIFCFGVKKPPGFLKHWRFEYYRKKLLNQIKLTALFDKPLKRLKYISYYFINTSINRGVNKTKAQIVNRFNGFKSLQFIVGQLE
ncbi:MAG: hypothetical protein A2057_09400 [Ignavibacteria bacterium GWA2_35_9]|nr:MAG: hypothetical protein A2057_09400 [Ignavibacteria bacterium GWA2_35_9]